MRAAAPEIRHANEAFCDRHEISRIAAERRGVARVDEAAAVEFEKPLVTPTRRNERVHRKMHQRRRFDVGRAIEKCAERLDAMGRIDRSSLQRIRRHVADIPIMCELHPRPTLGFVVDRQALAE